MSDQVTDQEFEAMLEKPAEARYEYFVKRCAGWDRVWGLSNPDGWASGSDDSSGAQTFAVWPHERFAAACADDEWSGYEPEAIDIGEWLDGWLPELAEDGRLVAVFPVPSGVSVPVQPDRVGEDLRTELARY